MRRLSVVVTALLLGLQAPATAEHIESYVRPGEPTRLFPAGFELPIDAQGTGALYSWADQHMGGWGGAYAGSEVCPADHVDRTPVVFVHGTAEDAPTAWTNSLDNENGTTVSVRRKFIEGGWCARELWAVSYTGARGYLTYNDANAEEVYDFIQNVLAHTGADKVDVVGHSLGVTVTRKAIRNHYAEDPSVSWLGKLVAIGGPNHGSTACRGVSVISHVCYETDPMNPGWLDHMNSIGETLPGHPTLVVYDSIADQFFLGPDARSPRLEGACNHDMPGTMHLAIARGPAAVPRYLSFLRDGVLPDCTP